MTELINAIGNFGVLIVIAGLFLWDWIDNKKNIKNSIKNTEKSNENTEKAIIEIKNNNNNISKSLELLQNSMENQNVVLQKISEKIDKLKKG